MLLEIGIVSLVGGLIALDRTAAFQFMISRPVVAAPVIGAIVGDLEAGIKVGMIIELLWIGYLPVGASVPPDETIVAILITAVAVLSRRIIGGPVEEIISLSLLFSVPLAVFAKRMDSYVRKANIGSAHAADTAADKADFKGIQRECLRGIKRFYLGYTGMVLVFSSTGIIMIPYVHSLMPSFVLSGLGKFYYVLPLIGAASVLSTVRVKRSLGLCLASFAVFLLFIKVFNG